MERHGTEVEKSIFMCKMSDLWVRTKSKKYSFTEELDNQKWQLEYYAQDPPSLQNSLTFLIVFLTERDRNKDRYSAV